MRTTSKRLWLVIAMATAATACIASGSGRYSASASATMPTMVSISPGVQVIEDYDEPVFYSSSAYWRYDGGVWYQSHTYTGGWERVTVAPAAIVSIQQPSMYVHYHASARGGARVEDHDHDHDHDRGHDHGHDHDHDHDHDNHDH